jgi:hypothetical protein
MKSVLSVLSTMSLVSLAACSPSGGGGGTATAFTIDACPMLEGNYETSNMRMKITESREATSYRVVIGEGAQELIIDGKSHALGSGANYVGGCSNDILQVDASAPGHSLKMRYYFNQAGKLVQEYTGERNETTVWDKK